MLWIRVFHPAWSWYWYRPWHWVSHIWRGQPNNYQSKLFCQWCAGIRLSAWYAARDAAVIEAHKAGVTMSSMEYRFGVPANIINGIIERDSAR
jgi:hypothetical protein